MISFVIPTSPSAATQWLGHEKRWAGCKLCPIGCIAKQKVLGRGNMDCDWVLCGEGPGKGEDVVGAPFVGRAGRLLDVALAQAGPARTFIMNLVACRPTDTLGGDNRAPTEKEILACSRRFIETFAMANPKRGVILLGRVPQHVFPILAVQLPAHLQEIAVFHQTHPAAILRQGGIGSTAFDNFVSNLTQIFTEGK